MQPDESLPRAEKVRSLVLSELADGRDLDELCDAVGVFHGLDSTFPAEALMELAADAFVACGSTRANRLEIDGLAERMLPEWPARGNVGHSKRRHCVQGAVLIAAGVEPEDTGWWSLDDLWLHALHAVVVFVRAAAERRQVSVAEICARLQTAQ